MAEETKLQHDPSEGCIFWKNHIRKDLCQKGIDHKQCAGKECQKRQEVQVALAKAENDTITMTVGKLKELCIAVKNSKDFEVWWKENRPVA